MLVLENTVKEKMELEAKLKENRDYIRKLEGKLLRSGKNRETEHCNNCEELEKELEECKTIKTRCKSVELLPKGNPYKSLKKQLNDAHSKIEELQLIRENSSEEVKKLEDFLSKLLRNHSAEFTQYTGTTAPGVPQQGTLAALQAKHQHSLSELDEKDSRLEMFSKQIEELKTKNERLSVQNSSLQDESVLILHRMKQLTDIIRDKENELSDVQSSYESLTQTLRDSTNTPSHFSLEQVLSSIRTVQEELQQIHEESKSKVQILNSENSHLKTQVQNLISSKSLLQRTLLDQIRALQTKNSILCEELKYK